MKPLSTGLILCLLLTPPLRAYDREVWTSYPNMNHVTALAEGDVQIYVATTGGIRRYDRFANRWLSPLTTLDGLPDNRVQRLAYDPNTGDLWFDTPSGSGVWMSRLETMSLATRDPVPQHYPPRAIPPVMLPFGYYLENNWIQGPRRTYAITDILIDSWRILWIGTRGLGVGRADLRDEQLEFLHFGPMTENVTAIALDGDRIWFGGEDTYRGPARGITRYHPSTDTWEYFQPEDIIGLDDVRVSAILPDSTDVWFGTWGGLVRYTKKSGQWLTYRLYGRNSDRITALARDSQRLWIGTRAGLRILDLKADTLRTVEGSERFAIRALDAGPDFIWAGTDWGLYRCARRDVTWAPVRCPEGLTKGPISAVFARAGKVWAAVEAPPALIHQSGSDTTWQRFPLSEVGGSRRVAIAADTSRVWVATDQGAFRLDIARKLWKDYTRFSGLIHDRVHAILLDGDYVWFGTQEGASRFHWARGFFEKNH